MARVGNIPETPLLPIGIRIAKRSCVMHLLLQATGDEDVQDCFHVPDAELGDDSNTGYDGFHVCWV